MRARARLVVHPFGSSRVSPPTCVLVRAWALRDNLPSGNSTSFSLAGRQAPRADAREEQNVVMRRKEIIAERSS